MGARKPLLVLACALSLLAATVSPAFAGATKATGAVKASGVTASDAGYFANDDLEYDLDFPMVPWDNDWGGAWHAAWGTSGSSTSYSHSFETSAATAAGSFLGMPIDEDWHYIDVYAGRFYVIWAQPVGPVEGADPVMELFTSDGVTVDPPATEYFRWSDDENWVRGNLRPMIQYHARQSERLYVRIVDDNMSGFEVSTWPTPVFSKKGVTYEAHFLDWGASADPFVERPTAPDRYTLAANLARESYPSGFGSLRHVIIACGQDAAAADSLVAAGLAGVYNAPVLLIDKTKAYLPAATKTVIQQMNAGNGANNIKFHIVGGPASVPNGMINQLKAAAPGASVDRLGGADRYEVAANVAARMRSVLGASYPKSAIFVNGHDSQYFWDAMMAGPIAFRMHYPILLTHRNGVPAKTMAAKAFYTGTKYAIGEAQSLGDGVPGLVGATRIDDHVDTANYDRQKLARYVAEYAEDNFWVGNMAGAASEVGVANKLADSLVGGTFMGFRNGPIVFARDNESLDWDGSENPPYTAEYLMQHAFYMRDGAGGTWIFGGPSSVWVDVEAAIASYTGRNSWVAPTSR